MENRRAGRKHQEWSVGQAGEIRGVNEIQLREWGRGFLWENHETPIDLLMPRVRECELGWI